MDAEQRIVQFKNMAEADPDNELGHFSLGKAYVEAGQHENALAPLRRTLELNPGYSRAYLLLGPAQQAVGGTDDAVATLQKGFEVADKRGDVMPRNEIGELLKKLGGAVPAVTESVTTTASVAVEGFHCSRCGGAGPALPERPFKGELGEQILAAVCAGCWQQWIGMGTKVINEMRLQLNIDEHQEIYDQQMKEFLSL